MKGNKHWQNKIRFQNKVLKYKKITRTNVNVDI